jgi:hypothetical protein
MERYDDEPTMDPAQVRDQIRGAAEMARLLMRTPGLDAHTRRLLRARAASDLRAARLVRDLAARQDEGGTCAGCGLAQAFAEVTSGVVVTGSNTGH